MVPRITAAPVWRDAAANPGYRAEWPARGRERYSACGYSRRFAQAMQAGAKKRPLRMRGDPGC